MIRKEMGLKTTILDKNEPLPAVLAEARRRKLQEEENSPQVVAPSLCCHRASVGTRSPGRAARPGADGRADAATRPPASAAGPDDRGRVIRPPAPNDPPPPPPNIPPTAATTPVPLVNTRAVALDFEVTRSGPSKVTAVELWTTRDGGATWAKTDRMTGCQSPFRTRLGSDGEYGFRLVMESGSGMRTPEPARARETGHAACVLDTKPPTVVLFMPQPIPGHAGKVQLRWQRTDPHLDPNYIRLEYSVDGLAWHAIPVGGARVPAESTTTGRPRSGCRRG